MFSWRITSLLYRWLVFTLLLPVVLIFAACADQPELEVAQVVLTPTPTPQLVGRGVGPTLHILHWQAPEMLNTHLTASNNDLEINRITYEPLATFDKDNNMVLLLAAEEPTLANGGVAADGKSVTWQLKRDVKWSDGEPFTADDVVFTYQFISNPEVNSPSSALYEAIESVQAVDDYTVKINFKEVTPAWNTPFVGLQGVILPRHIFEPYNGANAREAPANFMPVGTGPYRIVEPGIRPQEVLFLGTDLIQTVKIVYEPNPSFREADKPYFSKIELKGGGTPTEAARSALLVGEVDFAFNLQTAPELLTEWETNGKGHVIASFGARVEQIVINHTDPNKATAEGERSSLEFPHPFFSDKAVRQAVAFAINREAIAALYGSTGRPTGKNLVAPANYVSTNTFYSYNPDKAKEILDNAGWVDSNGNGFRDKDGVELKIVSHALVGSLQQQSQQIIKQNLNDIDIDVDVKLLDSSVFFGDPATNPGSVFRFQADIQSLDISSESPDPGSYMQYWISSQIPEKSNGWSGINLGRWSNAQYDELFKSSATEIDPEQRRLIFLQMNDLQVEDVAMIPLVHLAKVAGVSNAIEGVNPTPWDGDLWNVKDWRRSLP